MRTALNIHFHDNKENLPKKFLIKKVREKSRECLERSEEFSRDSKTSHGKRVIGVRVLEVFAG